MVQVVVCGSQFTLPTRVVWSATGGVLVGVHSSSSSIILLLLLLLPALLALPNVADSTCCTAVVSYLHNNNGVQHSFSLVLQWQGRSFDTTTSCKMNELQIDSLGRLLFAACCLPFFLA